MAISLEQRALRTSRLGSSDAPRLMAGQWRELWLEKTGRAEPPCLDFVPAVQIGIATEELHARFYTQRTGIGCFPAGECTLVHPQFDFIVAHLDFLTWETAPTSYEEPPDTVLEAKFHGGFKSEEELAEQYYWQLQHQLLVAGLKQAILSVLTPSSYSFLPVARNEGDIETLLQSLHAFWWHVENDIEPDDPLAVAPPDFETLRVFDMSLHNGFASLAGTLAKNRPAMLAYKAAETEIKALMPQEARVAYMPAERDRCGGVVVSRSRDGRLTLKFGDPPKKHWDKAEPWVPGLSQDGD